MNSHSIVASVAATLGHSLITRDERLELETHARAYQRKIDRLRRIAPRNSGLAKTETQQILSSVRAKVCAIVRTMPLSRSPSMGLAGIYAQADALTPSSLSDEVVRVRTKPKSGGGLRLITEFGPGRRAYQKITEDILGATLPPFSFDFGDGQGGVERMTDFIRRGLESGQYNHVVTADVKNCYGSITGKEYLRRKAGIPRWAFEKALTLDCHTRLDLASLKPSELSINPDEAVRRGIPQGASSSGLLMSRVCLGPVLAGTFFSDRMTLFGDNISVLARSRQDGEAIYTALRSVLLSSPVGPLTIGQKAIQSDRGNIVLVQYALKRRPARYGGGWRIIPSWKSIENYKRNIVERSAKGATLDEITAYTERWIASMRLWEPSSAALDHLSITMHMHWQLGQSAMTRPHRRG